MRLSQLLLEVVLVKGLKVRVASNVLLADEDVWHAALVGDLLQGILDSSTVVCNEVKSVHA